jgi:myo-inositol-1(or 4)-monophosphatase
MPPTDDAAHLEVAVRAAREGGRVAREQLGDPIHIRLKGRRDFEVGAALRVQQVIRDTIAAAYPDDGFLGEEGPEDEELPVGAEHLWVVDPIDGSTNFLQNLPIFSISIAYRDALGFRVGVVYDPLRDELFSATAGGGAQLNGQPIYVQRPGEGEDIYEQMLIGTDLPGENTLRVDALRALTHVANRMLGVVVLGSPALALGYIAAGRLHGYLHLKLQLWDVAAGGLILSEAGGILTNFTGGSWLHSDGGYVASNGAIHGVLLRLLRAALPGVRS